MARVKLEIWMRLGKELGKDFDALSEMRSIWEEEVKDGITVRDFFDDLANRYKPIREKIIGRGRSSFYPDVVATLNDRVITPSELFDRVLKDGDKITVLPMFAGG
jgi:molybdopterin converting factor small subunit